MDFQNLQIRDSYGFAIGHKNSKFVEIRKVQRFLGFRATIFGDFWNFAKYKVHAAISKSVAIPTDLLCSPIFENPGKSSKIQNLLTFEIQVK